MRKISLDADELQVESFETVVEEEERGTVHAYYSQFSCPRTQCGAQCPSGPHPCEGSYAWTDGYQACLCADTGACID